VESGKSLRVSPFDRKKTPGDGMKTSPDGMMTMDFWRRGATE
jgi:hypothetical protein